MSSPWHFFVERAGARHRSDFLEAIRLAGVSSHGLTSENAPGPGILFVGHINQSVCDLVRQLSRNGIERVLVVLFPGTSVTSGSAWRLLKSGASDVFSWDHSAKPAIEIAARFERWETIDGLVTSPAIKENLIGTSSAWISIVRQVVEVASFTDASVLITGETGTGKELIARLVHTLDARRPKRDLVILDCTTIVPELSGSEFFGHERGAFTGAVSARDGAFALANRGTLFLDEVGELPLTLQAELLRVVQEHTYKRVGSNTWQETDFRLVCATNKDLLHEESQGAFRRDFLYRIAGWVCKLPPLRERPEDIMPLACHFLRQLRPADEPGFDDGVREYLLQRSYPGNIRELRQLVCRISYRHVGAGPITVGDIPDDERPQIESRPGQWQDSSLEQFVRRAVAMGIGLKEISHMAANTAISIAVAEAKGNLHHAASLLGVTDRALQMRQAASRREKEDGHGPPPLHESA